jgi:cobalamin biosynthesis Mg chelatase CobN
VQGTYNVRCTAEDYTDHSEVVESSFRVEWASSGSSSSSGGSSGGGSSTSTETEEEEEEVIVEEEVVTETIVEAVNLDMNDQWIEEGVIELSGLVGGEVYSFATVDSADHSITIESVEGDTVVVVIASDPQTLTLTLVNPIGEVDLNGDGLNDLKVTLLGIVNGEASISVEQIDGLFEYPTSEKSYTWVWIVGILVVVLLVCLGLAYYFMRPKPKSKK